MLLLLSQKHPREYLGQSNSCKSNSSTDEHVECIVAHIHSSAAMISHFVKSIRQLAHLDGTAYRISRFLLGA
jgi:hypothetical protein